MTRSAPSAPAPKQRFKSAPANVVILKPIDPPPKPVYRPKTVLVHLARYGDLINILPIARYLKQTEGRRPGIICQKQFSELLDGVSYATYEPLPKDMEDFMAIGRAATFATNNYDRAIICQVYEGMRKCDAFNVESWLRAGFLPLWNRLPLVFDRRSAKRERELCAKYIDDYRPNVLVNTSGTSSPYQHGAELWTALRRKLPGHNLIDLAPIRAERIYDLLGLFDKAVSLVSTDTSTLHLAHASKVPVVGLISDFPDLWHGTRPRGNIRLTVRYQESQHRMDEIAEAAGGALLGESKLVHVYSDYQSADPNTQRRMDLAQKTWRTAYLSGGWEPLPIPESDLPRKFQDEGRTLPYVRDLIEAAIKNCTTEDIIVLTNADVCLLDGAEDLIRNKLKVSDAAYSFRTDFARLDRALTPLEVRTLPHERYSGADLFAFRASWWRAYDWKFPDLLLGAEAWDWVMRTLIDRTTQGLPALPDLIYHERHVTKWESGKLNLPSQLYNRPIAKAFLREHGVYNGELE